MYTILFLLWWYGIFDNFGLAIGNTIYFANLSCIYLSQPQFFDICRKNENSTEVSFLGCYLVTGKPQIYTVQYTPLPNNLSMQYSHRGGQEFLYPQASHVILDKDNLLLSGRVRKGRTITNQVQCSKCWPLC